MCVSKKQQRRKSKLKSDEIKEFLANVIKTDTCWIWKGAVTGDRYGSFTYNKTTKRAHRASYELFNGEIPEGLMVLHDCDVRICVNPEHLRVGTAKDNSHDMISRNRNKQQNKNCGDRAVLGIRIPPKLDGEIVNIAKSMGISKNDLFILIITEYIKKTEKELSA
jgi:hypothetical protein